MLEVSFHDEIIIKGTHQERISEPVHKTHNKEQPIEIFQSSFVYTTTVLAFGLVYSNVD